jgi:hypothetical protein
MWFDIRNTYYHELDHNKKVNPNDLPKEAPLPTLATVIHFATVLADSSDGKGRYDFNLDLADPNITPWAPTIAKSFVGKPKGPLRLEARKGDRYRAARKVDRLKVAMRLFPRDYRRPRNKAGEGAGDGFRLWECGVVSKVSDDDRDAFKGDEKRTAFKWVKALVLKPALCKGRVILDMTREERNEALRESQERVDNTTKALERKLARWAAGGNPPTAESPQQQLLLSDREIWTLAVELTGKGRATLDEVLDGKVGAEGPGEQEEKRGEEKLWKAKARRARAEADLTTLEELYYNPLPPEGDRNWEAIKWLRDQKFFGQRLRFLRKVQKSKYSKRIVVDELNYQYEINWPMVMEDIEVARKFMLDRGEDERFKKGFKRTGRATASPGSGLDAGAIVRFVRNGLEDLVMSKRFGDNEFAVMGAREFYAYCCCDIECLAELKKAETKSTSERRAAKLRALLECDKRVPDILKDLKGPLAEFKDELALVKKEADRIDPRSDPRANAHVVCAAARSRGRIGGWEEDPDQVGRKGACSDLCDVMFPYVPGSRGPARRRAPPQRDLLADKEYNYNRDIIDTVMSRLRKVNEEGEIPRAQLTWWFADCGQLETVFVRQLQMTHDPGGLLTASLARDMAGAREFPGEADFRFPAPLLDVIEQRYVRTRDWETNREGKHEGRLRRRVGGFLPLLAIPVGWFLGCRSAIVNTVMLAQCG